ncbi:hypothetical protein PSHT_16426 [Puccinia striiformis]|uniref:Uncharacterized protein n=1 Tax=Puccinia striiformis TaxID=27350 RepID=A0A2S4UAB3_9BASI|nr:hypothetical protein PSHT_16426 [Puccinia striiformis]
MSFPSRRVGPADDRMRPDDAAIRHHPPSLITSRATEPRKELRKNYWSSYAGTSTFRPTRLCDISNEQIPPPLKRPPTTPTKTLPILKWHLPSRVSWIWTKRLRNLFDAVIPEAGRINALEQPSMRNPDPPISSSDTDASPVGTERNLLKTNSRQDLNVFRESNGLANQVDRERIYALLHRIEYGTNNHTPNQVDHLSHPMGMGVGSVQANPEALASNLSVPGSVSPSRPSSMRIEVDPIRSSDRHKRT